MASIDSKPPPADTLSTDSGKIRDRERALILLCCSVRQIDETRTGIRRLLGGEIDWRRFISLTAQNGVAPLVVSCLLERDCRVLLPAAIARQFTLVAEATALRNSHLADRLIEIVAVLKREAITSLALKGVAIAAGAYLDLKLRSFGDLDVLVPRADVVRAVNTLGKLGFASKAWNAGVFASGFFPDTSLDLAGPDMVLDLHWQLAADYFPFGPDTTQAFRNAVEVDLSGGSVLTLGAADSILFQASHAAKHGWMRLQYVCDFAKVTAAAREIESETLLRQADAAGCRTMLLTGVSLAVSMLGAEFPHPLLSLAEREPRVATLGRIVERRMFEIRDEGMFSEWAVAKRSIDAWSDRIRYLAKRLLRPRMSDAALLSLPRALYPLYYVARPASLAIKHCRSLFDGNPRPREPVYRPAIVVRSSPTLLELFRNLFSKTDSFEARQDFLNEVRQLSEIIDEADRQAVEARCAD